MNRNTINTMNVMNTVNRLAMKSLFAISAVSTAALLLGSTTIAAQAAPQQGQNQEPGYQQGGGPGGQGGPRGQGGPGGQGRPGGFGGGGGGGFGGRMGNMTPSAANLPLRLMATSLSLNESQISRIALSRDDMQQAQMMPPMRRGANGANGGENDMQAMFAEMQAKRQAAEKKTVAEIKAVLTPEQVSRLALLIKAMESLQTAGIRGEALGKLNLTDTQMNSIARGGDIATILTPDQITITESYRIPQGGPGGGPGGFGGGRPGGPGRPGQGRPGGQGGPPPPQ